MKLAKHTMGSCALALSLGCYTYVPTTLDVTPAGTHIQALMSTEGQIILRNRIGIDDPLLKGELLEQSGETVLMSVRSGSATDEFGMRESMYQRVDIPKSHILRVDQRQMDAFRTGSLIAAAAGAGVFLVIQATGERNPGDVPNGGGGPDERVASWILGVPFSIR